MRLHRGQSLPVVLMVSAAVASLAVAIPMFLKSLNQQARITRVKAVMGRFEVAMRLVMAKDSAWECVNPADNPYTCDKQPTLTVRNLYSSPNGASVRQAVLGAVCPPSNPACGLFVKQNANGPFVQTDKDGNPNPAGNYYSLWIQYEGGEVKIKDRTVTFLRPSLVSIPRCTTAKPWFRGRDAAGTTLCDPLPSDCPRGQILTDINWKTMTYVCTPVTCGSASSCQCGIDHFAKGITWNRYSPKLDCTGDRYDPWTQLQ